MKDGSILHRLDVSSRPVTCIQFLKKDYTHFFVGCLEPALRLYDFDTKNLSKIHRISDEIRCMDSMWDYVFMGGKNGYLIRYGCKVLSFEFTLARFTWFFFCRRKKLSLKSKLAVKFCRWKRLKRDPDVFWLWDIEMLLFTSGTPSRGCFWDSLVTMLLFLPFILWWFIKVTFTVELQRIIYWFFPSM